MFDSFCERAMANGSLQVAERDRLVGQLQALPTAEQDAMMLEVVAFGLRGVEVEGGVREIQIAARASRIDVCSNPTGSLWYHGPAPSWVVGRWQRRYSAGL